MFANQWSGYILPEGFNTVSMVFERVLDARHIDRRSEEGACLARHALKLYMNGIHETWRLEGELEDASPANKPSLSPIGSERSVVDFLPELFAWARSLTSSPKAAASLMEQTLEYAIDHIDEAAKTSDLRGWLVGRMYRLRFDAVSRPSSWDRQPPR